MLKVAQREVLASGVLCMGGTLGLHYILISCNDVALACIRSIMRDYKTLAKNECGIKNLYPSNAQMKTCN